MPDWNQYLSTDDLKAADYYQKISYLKRPNLGYRPAILVIDVNYHFLGPQSLQVIDVRSDWPLSCGSHGWNSVASIEQLINEARRQNCQVIYTTAAPTYTTSEGDSEEMGYRRSKIPEQIAPQQEDLVLVKSKPSAFFGTQLVAHLIGQRITTLVVVGCTTSGCVLATVIDAASYGFNVVIPEQAVFDRFQASHDMSLFNMHLKYAHVQDLETTLEYLKEDGEVQED